MAQLCAIHLVRNKVLGDVPVLAIAWASPKIGNECLANWVAEQESLRILRLRVPVDIVSNSKFFPKLEILSKRRGQIEAGRR